jgi:hypothetical protein
VPNGGVRKVGYTGIVGIEMCGEQGAGGLLLETIRHKRGSLEVNG